MAKDLTGEKQLPVITSRTVRSKGLNGSACYTATQKITDELIKVVKTEESLQLH